MGIKKNTGNKTKRWKFLAVFLVALTAFLGGMMTLRGGKVYADEPQGEAIAINFYESILKGTASDSEQVLTGEDESYGEDNENDDGGEGPTEVKEKCMNAGGAQSLGWVICPIMTWIGEGASDLYDKAVKPLLQVNPQLFGEGKGEVTKQGWETFRNIANVLFIILFMIVIFSQLTGVGIDNYGIKRILPKLIVAAILINLSYWLCLLVIDISNIIGGGIEALLSSLSNSLGDITLNIPDSDVKNARIREGTATGATLIIVALIIAFVKMTGAIWKTPAIVLSLFVTALGLGIGVLFLFLLLGAREAAIVILTVISPLAVVCYMLPNTKKIFDRWFNIFKGLLLVFPICSLLVGGGDYVATLLLSSGMNESFFGSLVAMLIGIVPIFFIPAVLKSSFAAMGNLGAKIAGFGDTMRGKVAKSARGSSIYQGAQERTRRYATRKKVGIGNKYAGRSGAYAAFRRGLVGGTKGIERTRAQFMRDEAQEEEEKMSNVRRMLRNGMMGVDGQPAGVGNPAVNMNDINSMGAYHAAALTRYAKATNDVDRKNAMTEVKAAQEILSKTEAGRNMVRGNIANAVIRGQNAGLAGAASHLAEEYGDLYKSKDRGTNALINDLAAAERGLDGEVTANGVATVGSNLASGRYDAAGAESYTQESLTEADTEALKRMSNAMASGGMEGQAKQSVQGTAQKVMEMYSDGKISLKPETKEYIEQIARGGGVIGGGVSTGGDNSSTGTVTSGASVNVGGASTGGASGQTTATVGASTEGQTINVHQVNGETVTEGGLIINARDDALREAQRQVDREQKNNPNWPGNNNLPF